MFPKLVLINIFIYLDEYSVQKVSLTNKKIYDICKNHVWLSKCKCDFSKLFSELPEPINKPLWQRVYFHLKDRFELENRISINKDKHVQLNENPYINEGNIKFQGFNMETNNISIWDSFNNSNYIISKLLYLGAYIYDEEELILYGTYKYINNIYNFTLLYKDNENQIGLYVSIDNINYFGKTHKKILSDIERYIKFAPSKYHKSYINNIQYSQDISNEIFILSIPNIEFIQPYSYYYLPSEIISYSGYNGFYGIKSYVNDLDKLLENNFVILFDKNRIQCWINKCKNYKYKREDRITKYFFDFIKTYNSCNSKTTQISMNRIIKLNSK